VDFVGHLDPDHQFHQEENLIASIGKNGDTTYLPGVLTTVDYVKEPEPSYDSATIQDQIYSSVIGTNATAGSIWADIFSWQRIDNSSAQFTVTIPKNTFVGSILMNSNYWQDPVYTTNANGQQQLTFVLKPHLTKEQVAGINRTPVVNLKSIAVYVPALKSEDGDATIIMNGKQQDQKTFNVSLIAATADYLLTTARGNMDASDLNQATNDDKKTAHVTLNYDFVNGNPNTNLTGLTFVGNLPQKQDGKSQVDVHLTGPVHVVDYLTGQSMDSDVVISYSTNYYQPDTVQKADLTGFVSADQVHDWSKIKSFRVDLKKPLTGGNICQIQAPALVVDQVNNVNKVAYLSGAVFGDGIMPYRLVPAGTGSAQIKIQGVSTVHQKVHYVDAAGHDHNIDLGSQHDIKLTDNVDKLTINGFPTDAEGIIPQYYHWDQQAPTIGNDADAHYPDGLANKIAQLGTVSQYYFDGDSIVWNLVPDKQEQITVDQVIKYHYYGSNKQAAPDYTKSAPAIVYLNPFTNQVDGIELQQELPAVTSPSIKNYHALRGEFSAWQARHQYTEVNGISLDLTHHVAHIKGDDYYVSAAAQLVVVDPNTHMAKKVTLAYDDGSHQIKFADTDDSLKLAGYQMHVYYQNTDGMPVYNDDVHKGYPCFNLKTDPLIYPYAIDENSSTEVSPQQENYLRFDHSFPGYDSLTAAMSARDTDGKPQGQYDDHIDISDDSDGRVTLTPTQIFFVFYTPVKQELQEQFLITADNDPLANSKSEFLKHIAIPKAQADAVKSDIYQSTGKAGTIIFPKADGTGSAQLPLPTDPYMGGIIDLNSPQYSKFKQWLISHGYATAETLSASFNNNMRPGYVIDRADYQFTNDAGVTNTYSIQMHTTKELSALIKEQPHAKVVLTEGGTELSYKTNMTGNAEDGYQGDDIFASYVPSYSDFREVDAHHYVLDVYNTQSYSDNQPAIPVLLSMRIFNPNGQHYDPSMMFDQTAHEIGTPDPHPQVLNVHFKKLGATDLFTQHGNIEIHYQDVSDLQPSHDGKYVYGGGYDANAHFSHGTNYDAHKLKDAADQDPDISNLVNEQHGSTGAGHYYQVGQNDSGAAIGGVSIQFAHDGDPSGMNDPQKDQTDQWKHYDISAVNNYVANDDQYVIVQEDPQAQNGDHMWKMLNPAGYASADDPTGEKTLAKYMLEASDDWSMFGQTHPQVYYVYLKRKQKLNYRVLVEDKDGHVVKTLTPETLLGVGGSNEQVATTKLHGAMSSDSTTLGDRYQSIIKQLADRGFQAVTAADGQLKVSDSLAQLTFDNDATKDQLVTIYVTQPKTVQIHYVDVDGSSKTGNYTVNDGTDQLEHMQTVSGLAGSDYQNQLWDWNAAGYVLATSEDQIAPGATNGSFQLTDPTSRAFYIFLKHQKKSVNDHAVVKHETIHYVYEDGSQAKPDYQAPDITFNRTGVKDLVTNDIAWNPWTTDNDTFTAVTSPKIDGYTPDKDSVDAVKMTVDKDDVVQTVTYHADGQKLTVKFIDDSDNGKVLKTVTKSGTSNGDAGYSTKGDIQAYEGQHYVLVSDSSDGEALKFDDDDAVDQSYEVHLKHDTRQDQQKVEVLRTIKYVYEDGQQAQPNYDDSLTFYEKKVVDLIDGHTISDDWTPAQDFKTITTPAIQGYTPDRTAVANKGIAHDHAAITEMVTYKAEQQKLTVKFIDDSDHGKVLKTVAKSGTSGADAGYNTKDDIQTYEGQHYTLVSDETNGQALQFDKDKSVDQYYEVHLKHATQSASDTDKVTEIIHYVYADGTKAAKDYTTSVDFKRTGTKDLVTDTIKWEPVAPQSFASHQSPTLAGYTADVLVVPQIEVHYGDADVARTVTYTADQQQITVNYIDDVTGKTLKTDQLMGKSGQKSGYRTKSSIDGYLGQHYQLVADDTKGQELVYDHDSTVDQVYNVHLTHATASVSDTVIKHETIHYVYTDGRQALPDYDAPVITFTRTGIKDLVTNEIAWNPWTTANDTFAAVTSPTINGYTPDISRVDAVKMTAEKDNVEQTVTYAQTHETPQSDRPGKPNQPDQPGNPDQPDQPGKPNQPGQPGNPDQPDQPGKPNQPGQPANLDQPDQPGKPNQPGQPASPDQPNNGDENYQQTPLDNQSEQQHNQQLPQTGNKGNRWAVFGVALSSMMGLGLGKRRKQD
jgi:LPXTG-motif cell wall-anchored protein